MNMHFIRKLPIPQDIKAEYPISPASQAIRAARDKEIKDVLAGRDDRLLLLIGPCSADFEDSVLDYVSRLARLQERVKDRVLIVPRVYTQKPRSSGDGYMGMLHQPDPTASPDLLRGIIAIRALHIRVLAETGLSCADEMLYPENHRYLSDVLAYATVGARSVENQQHRLTASGLDIPVGMKNPTGGDLSVLANALSAAHHPHKFLYRGWEVESAGNPYAHAILRGFTDGNETRSNYDAETLCRLLTLDREHGIENPAVLIDTNHANSGKRFDRQPEIAREVMALRKSAPELSRFVRGLMIESYIEDGAQPIGGGIYGKSITDPCLGWEKTERLILDLAEANA